MEQKIKDAFAQGFLQGEINLEDLAALAAIFGATKKEDFGLIVNLFENDYPFLKDFLAKEKNLKKENFENAIRKLLIEIIKKDPSLAQKISQDAMRKNMTLEKLTEKYPILKQHKL